MFAKAILRSPSTTRSAVNSACSARPAMSFSMAAAISSFLKFWRPISAVGDRQIRWIDHFALGVVAAVSEADADAHLVGTAVVAGGYLHPGIEIDDVLPARCRVPIDVVFSLGLAEDDPDSRQVLGKLAASPLLDPLDFDVAEMRLAAGIVYRLCMRIDLGVISSACLPVIPHLFSGRIRSAFSLISGLQRARRLRGYSGSRGFRTRPCVLPKAVWKTLQQPIMRFRCVMRWPTERAQSPF